MNKLIKVLLIAVFAFAANTANADKYIIFISGYGGDVWTKSSLPAEWDGNLVPDGNVLILDNAFLKLPDEIKNVYNNVTNSNNYARDWFFEFLERSIKTEMINLFGGDSDVEIILVGHSVGGYAARMLEQAINSWSFPSPIQQVKVIGVLTTATPHQGAKVTELSMGSRTGFKDISDPVNEFKVNLREPLDPDYNQPWISWAVNNFAGSEAVQTLNDLPDLIDDGYKKLVKQQFIGVTFGDGENFNLELYAKGLFKEDGVVPQLLNGINTNTPQRSVFGVEKSATIVRAADEVIGNGQEKETVDNVSELRRYYKAQEDAWWLEHEIEYYSTRHYMFGARKRANARKDEYKRRSRLWKAGRHAIEGIDRTWTEVIDAYALETQTYEIQTYVGCDGDQDYRLDFPSFLLEGPECIDDGWVTTTGQYTAPVAQKNDALSVPHNYVLKRSDKSNYATTTSNGNYFYSDTEAKGGYNHMEIRRLRRTYNDSGNGIVKGEKAKPMREAEEWLTRDIIK